MQETLVRFLGWKVPLDKEMATYSMIFAWRIPWTEERSGLQSMGFQRVRHDWAAKHSTAHEYFIKLLILSKKEKKKQRLTLFMEIKLCSMEIHTVSLPTSYSSGPRYSFLEELAPWSPSPMLMQFFLMIFFFFLIYRGNNGDTDIECRLMDTGRGKKRVRCMERITWKLTLPYVK